MIGLAAIKATFSDYKRIRSRKVAILCFEVPLEALHDTIAKLGGEPSMHEDTWCAIARLQTGLLPKPETREMVIDPEKMEYVPAPKPKREITLANKIGALCDKESFQEFLHIKYNDLWIDIKCEWQGRGNYEESKVAGEIIRRVIDVKSRSEIEYDTIRAAFWKTEIYLPYESWLSSSLKGEER